MYEFFLKENRHRLVVWVCFFLCIVFPLLLLCSSNIREWAFLQFIPKDRKIVELFNEPGSFYDADTDTYGMRGIPLGRSYGEMISALEMEDWVEPAVPTNIFLGTVHIKAFNSVYVPAFHSSDDGNSTFLSFEATLMRSDAHLPVRSYAQACDYVDEMFRQFIAEYGEPDETNFGTYSLRDVPEDCKSEELYAVWWSEDRETQLKLRAYKVVYTHYKHPKPELIFKIAAGIPADERLIW